MKTMVLLLFGGRGDRLDIDTARQIFEKIGLPDWEKKRGLGGYTVQLEKGDWRLSVLLDELERLKIRPFIREDRVYTEEELLSAKLLLLTVTEYTGDGADTFGTEFDDSKACSHCGLGLVQQSDLIIDKREMGETDIAITYSFEVVISAKLASLIKTHELTGYELRLVHHFQQYEGDEPELFQLFCTNVLPPMGRATQFEKHKSCEECGRHGLFLRSQPCYTNDVLMVAKDFNYTFEYFGVRRPFVSHQHIVISPRVYDLFLDNKIKNYAVEPIRFVD
jgi:ribosomal protein L37E